MMEIMDMKEMVTLPLGYVAIPVEEYVDLIEANNVLGALTDVLYDGAKLSWDKKKLSFDDDAINVLLKSFNSKYDWFLKDLQKEAEHEETRTDID